MHDLDRLSKLSSIIYIDHPDEWREGHGAWVLGGGATSHDWLAKLGCLARRRLLSSEGNRRLAQDQRDRVRGIQFIRVRLVPCAAP